MDRELLFKRRKALRQIDKYSLMLCKKCRDVPEIQNCNCQAARNIRKIGDRLLKLLPPRKNESTEILNALRVPENLTGPIYSRLKYLGVTDKVICGQIGIKSRSFAKWRRSRGIHSKY